MCFLNVYLYNIARVANSRKLMKLKKQSNVLSDNFFKHHIDRIRPFIPNKIRRRLGDTVHDKKNNVEISEAEQQQNEENHEVDNAEEDNEQDEEEITLPTQQQVMFDPSEDFKTVLSEQPKSLDKGTGFTLRPYQLIGLNWLISRHEHGISGILGDEMGLGKTLQVISFLAYLHEQKFPGPHLVVCPLSVLSSWKKEFERWCPSLRIVILHGSPDERLRIANEVAVYGQFDVVITTYEIVKAEFGFLSNKFHWGYLIIDEGHKIKNEHSNQHQLINAIKRYNTILMTGTPTQNNMHEMWAMLSFLFPSIFSNSEPFDRCFDLQRQIVNPAMLRRAHLMLQPLMIRRIKTDLENKLPPKTETKIYVKLAPAQTMWYKRLLMRDLPKQDLDRNEIKGEDNSGESPEKTHEPIADNGDHIESVQPESQPKLSSTALTTVKSSSSSGREAARGGSQWRKLMSLFMQLRKVCNHPYLFER